MPRYVQLRRFSEIIAKGKYQIIAKSCGLNSTFKAVV